MSSRLQAAVALVEGGCKVEFAFGRAGEIALRLGAQGRLVILERKQVIGAGVDDLLGDRRIAGDGVDGNQGAVEVELFQQLRDNDDLIGFLVDGLLAENQLGVGGEGREEMQRPLVGVAIMAAPRGFAVNGHEIGAPRPSLRHPGAKRRREHLRIEPVHQGAQPIRAGHAKMEFAKPAQEVEVGFSPIDDVLVVVAIGDGGADDQEQHLPQRIHHPPRLALVLNRGKMLQKQRQARLRQGQIMHRQLPNQDDPRESLPDPPRKRSQPKIRVNPNSEPRAGGAGA